MLSENYNQFIRSIELNKEKITSFKDYPFCLEAVKSLDKLDMHPKVTYIIGENGTGKSTILEAVAAAYGFNPEGGTINFNFSTRDTHSELYEHIKLIKGVKRAQDGFFLRAESFYNAASYIDEIDKDFDGLTKVIGSYGGKSLHNQSHGEAFLALMLNRFGGRGLYILDEPEAALSPSRQMTMLKRIHELVQKKSQFIIATHSPIIMAYPDSVVYEINEGFKKTTFENTEHFAVMKTFLNNPEKMLKIILE